MNIENKIKEILKRDFDIKNVSGSKKLAKDLKIDALDMAELVLALEKELNISLPDSIVKNYDFGRPEMTFADLVRQVEQCVVTNKAKESGGLMPVAGLYAIFANKPYCCITGKPCNQLTVGAVKQNVNRKYNLCHRRGCIIERNFQRLAQKTK